MKRFFCILLTALMLLCVVSFAEDASTETVEVTELTTEDKLAAMLPVLDSFALSMGITGEVEYTTEDAAFVWDQLYLLNANWYDEDQLSEDYLTIVVPSEEILEDMNASFYDLEALPEIPEEFTSISYDEDSDTYSFMTSDRSYSYVVIEKYAADEDGNLRVGFGLYSYDEDENPRLGGLCATLIDPETLLTEEESEAADEDEEETEVTYYYAVTNVWAETDTDFDGMIVTECDIRDGDDEETEDETTEYTKLSEGSTGDEVRALQTRLNALGYDCGTVDGIFGSATKRAVRYFQDAIGVTQNGIASASLQEALFASDAPTYVKYVSLKKGSTGIRVEDLQTRLRELGYLAEPVDGDYGSRTETAVKLFQKTAGLTQDGIAGVKTLKALYSSGAPDCDTYITLRKGDTGSRVKEMQKQLAKLGFLSSKKVSGTYDSSTVSAVKAFKEAIGVSGNGSKADASLIKKMFSYVAATATPTATTTPEPDATDTPEPDATDTPEPDATDTPEPSDTETTYKYAVVTSDNGATLYEKTDSGYTETNTTLEKNTICDVISIDGEWVQISVGTEGSDGYAAGYVKSSDVTLTNESSYD